jgi:hypothetical protein
MFAVAIEVGAARVASSIAAMVSVRFGAWMGAGGDGQTGWE